MQVFGRLPSPVHSTLSEILVSSASLLVARAAPPRSGTPYPASEDLERALLSTFSSRGFEHHVDLVHPKTGERFEYDFWRPSDGVAVEIMGYRADDEVYKDILKFHVHAGTNVGVAWVPRWKWISGRRQPTNYAAAKKALAFADSFMNVEALVLIAYDWTPAADGAPGWRLMFPGE